MEKVIRIEFEGEPGPAMKANVSVDDCIFCSVPGATLEEHDGEPRLCIRLTPPVAEMITRHVGLQPVTTADAVLARAIALVAKGRGVEAVSHLQRHGLV